MSLTLNFNQLAAQILLDQINYDNNCALTLQYVTIGTPSAQASSAARNTSVTLTAVSGSGFTGSATYTYNRVDMSVIPGIRSTLIQLPANAVNISDMLTNINAAYGIDLVASDIVDGPLPTFQGLPNEKQSFVLQAAASCLVYINSVTLTAYNDGTTYQQVVTSSGQVVETSSGQNVVIKNPEATSSS